MLRSVLCLAVIAVSAAGQTLFVDDDGAQCPGALHTIQEAVAQAPAEATILVCPGVYRKTVTVKGPARNGLRIIAIGSDDEVTLLGDHTEAHGFVLQDVQSVLIRGFTIRDFGNKRTTASQYGWGSGIYLQNARYSTIEQNRVSRTDLAGIIVSGSANNLVRHNLVFETDPNGFGCGIYLEGKKSVNNHVFQNYVYRQSGAGIHLGGAGSGNVILDNDSSNNGHAGILHENTEGTRIEGNRLSYNAGAWGISPSGQGGSFGIELVNSSKVTVSDNQALGNTAFDVFWDKKGEMVFGKNACGAANQPGLCGQ